jgi:hypothetical protein
MAISDNRIARSVPSRLVKRSYSRNNLFPWMVSWYWDLHSDISSDFPCRDISVMGGNRSDRN